MTLEPGVRAELRVHTLSTGADDLVLATIVPAPWPPDPNRQDAEYLAHLEREAEQTHARARAELGNELNLDCVLHRARSVSSTRRTNRPPCWRAKARLKRAM